jgi:hypothetical protein
MAQTKSSRSTSSRSGGSKSRSGGSSRSSGSSKALSGAPKGGLDGATMDEELYRRAAEDALQQLDWAIGYLHGIRKTEISKALAANRTHIRQRLLGKDAQPDPSAQTDQT